MQINEQENFFVFVLRNPDVLILTNCLHCMHLTLRRPTQGSKSRCVFNYAVSQNEYGMPFLLILAQFLSSAVLKMCYFVAS